MTRAVDFINTDRLKIGAMVNVPTLGVEAAEVNTFRTRDGVLVYTLRRPDGSLIQDVPAHKILPGKAGAHV
jgi:hypothetical protein